MSRSVVLSLGLLLVACGTSGSGPGQDTDGDTDDGSSSGEADFDTDDQGVPREPLGGDPMTACPGAYQSEAPVAGENRGFISAEQERDFWLMLPDDLGQTPRPLFVALNGTGEDGRYFAERAVLEDFVARGFIVVAPSSNGNGTVWPVWDALRADEDLELPNADLTYFDDLLGCLAAHYPIDANRIYVGGHSAGGHMTHYLLQRRSEVIAGGIPASGVFSLTSPAQPDALDPNFVIVTWGGEGDIWEGEADGAEISVPAFNFVEQAALASQFYAEQPAVGQVHCSAEVGHAWLDAANDWMAEQLLAHPKGVTAVAELPPAPAEVSCSADVFEFDAGISVTCVGDDVPGCQAVCQGFGDCAVENGTVASLLAPQLTAFGFSGEDNTECGGCIERCEQTIDPAIDEAVLQCIADRELPATCGPGIEGALPLTDAVNACCDGQTESAWCADVCAILQENTAVLSFFTVCEQFGG